MSLVTRGSALYHDLCCGVICLCFIFLQPVSFQQVPIGVNTTLFNQAVTFLTHSLPDCLKITHPNTCVILNCTENNVQTQSSKVLNSEFYSSYKSHTTDKGLVEISPNGAVTFVSSLSQGTISD